ncbi:MAG: ABC transporter permease [Planctomycetota bacterium]
MTGMIVSRLIQLPLVLLAIYTATFVLAWAIPGDAVAGDEDKLIDPAVLASIKARYALDDPARFYVEYLDGATGLRWARRSLAGEDAPGPVFDLGPSFTHADWTVNEILASSLGVSITLGLLAVGIALVIGLTAGVIGALRPGSAIDAITLVVALVGVSLPSFVNGTALLMVFPVWLGLGTVGGWGTFADLWLPAFTLSLPYAAYVARLTRLGMIDALRADHVRTARAKGCSAWRVVMKHALKNAFLPVLSYLGPACAFAMTGSFVVEKVFNVPGVGQHFVDAVLGKDLFVIMGVTLVFSALIVTLNLLVDVLYRVVDPRIE